MFRAKMLSKILKKMYRIMEVVSGESDLRIYLKSKYPSIFGSFKPNPSRAYKYRGTNLYFNNQGELNQIFAILEDNIYNIPECHVKKGDIVMDCGANIGAFSFLAARKASLVFAFEPLPLAYETLKKNIVLWGFQDKIIPCKKAVYSKECIKLFFYNNEETITSSIYREFNPRYNKVIKVRCTTIDNFVKKMV